MPYKLREDAQAFQRRRYEKRKVKQCAEHVARYANDQEFRERRKAYMKARHANPDIRKKCNEAARQYSRKRKQTVIEHYGGKCACCGESSIEFLCIDHIAGGGNKHRKEIGLKSGSGGFYSWLQKSNYPSGFRVLCHNCNATRGSFGYCPHEKVVTSFIRSGLGLPAIAA